MKREHCSKGFHQLHRGYIEVKKGKQRRQKVEYLKCRFCTLVIFQGENPVNPPQSAAIEPKV